MRSSSPFPLILKGFRACLPHELFFALLFVTCISGLCLARKCNVVVLGFFISLLIAQSLLIGFCHSRPTQERWRLRLVFYALVIPLVYPLLPLVADGLGCHLQDLALQHIDAALVGLNLSVYLQKFNDATVSEVLSAAYMFYTIYFSASEFLYLYDEIKLAIRFYIGLFTVFAVGFLGYVLVPAHGPYLALSDNFTTAVSGGFITHLNQEIVRLGSIRIDVFPSLHCAVPVFILAFDFFHKRRRFWVCLLPCLLLLSSTLYLRYHYLTDLLAGFCLAMFALGLSTWWPLQKHLQAVERPRSSNMMNCEQLD